jgi:hypothetical protein
MSWENASLTATLPEGKKGSNAMEHTTYQEGRQLCGTVCVCGQSLIIHSTAFYSAARQQRAFVQKLLSYQVSWLLPGSLVECDRLPNMQSNI